MSELVRPHKNMLSSSAVLLANYVLVSSLGFGFWLLAARMFSPSVIGTVNSLLGVLGLLATVGSLGLQNLVVRYLAGDDCPRTLLWRSIAAVTILCAGLGALIALLPNHVGIPISQLSDASLAALTLFLTLMLALTVGTVSDAAVIARGNAKGILAKNLLASAVRLSLLPLAVDVGALGLLGAFAVGAWIATSLSLYLALQGLPRRSSTASDVWHRSKSRFSFLLSNYFSALVSLLPTALLPTLVLYRIGSREAAFVAVPLLIVAALNAIPGTASQSLFAEVSQGQTPLGAAARAALRWSYMLLLPSVLATFVLADWVLSWFGSAYADAGTRCLQFMALGSLLGAFNYVADVALNCTGRVGWYATVNIGGTIVMILSLLFAVQGGLVAIGVGWLVGQAGYSTLAALALWVSGRNNTTAKSCRVGVELRF